MHAYVCIYISMYVHVYKYIYIYIEECIFRQQDIIQARFVKDDGTLFIISNFIFSKYLVIFLMSVYRWLRNCPISCAQAHSTILWLSSGVV